MPFNILALPKLLLTMHHHYAEQQYVLDTRGTEHEGRAAAKLAGLLDVGNQQTFRQFLWRLEERKLVELNTHLANPRSEQLSMIALSPTGKANVQKLRSAGLTLAIVDDPSRREEVVAIIKRTGIHGRRAATPKPKPVVSEDTPPPASARLQRRTAYQIPIAPQGSRSGKPRVHVQLHERQLSGDLLRYLREQTQGRGYVYSRTGGVEVELRNALNLEDLGACWDLLRHMTSDGLIVMQSWSHALFGVALAAHSAELLQRIQSEDQEAPEEARQSAAKERHRRRESQKAREAARNASQAKRSKRQEADEEDELEEAELEELVS